MRQLTTLAIIRRDDQVLLAMKKHGHGAGWWNGYGGKVEPGETVETAMVRELREESGLIAKTYRPRGVLEFYFDGTDKIVEMHIFEVTKYQGEPVETDEMAPKWFALTDIPYDRMWPADRGWMELYFAGHDVAGKAVFDGQTKAFVSSDFRRL